MAPSFAVELVPLIGGDERHDEIHGELHFELTQGKGPIVVKTHKKVIQASGSEALKSLLREAEKRNEHPTKITLTRIENPAAFMKAIEILERIADSLEKGKIHALSRRDFEMLGLEFANCDELSALILYAQRFLIYSLSEAIAVHLESDKFLIPNNDINTIDPVLRLVATLSQVIPRAENAGQNDWNGRILNWVVKHILIYSYLGDAHKKVYDRLKRAFRTDAFMSDALTPSAEVIDQCIKIGESIVTERRRSEAREIARALRLRVNDKYTQKYLDKEDGAIFLRVKACLATEIRDALKVETQDAYKIEIYPAEDVPNDMCCFSSFPSFGDTNNCQNPEPCIAYLTATFINWLLPQLTQCLSLGGCFSCFRDCRGGSTLADLCRAAIGDGRFGQAIYSCIYSGLTSMVNCCRGNGCQGATKSLRLVRKAGFNIPEDNEEHKH